MKIIRGLGKAIKPLVNFPAWMGWKQIKGTGVDIGKTAKILASTPKAAHQETYAEAVRRLGLSEADIQQRMKNFRIMSMVYALIALGIFGYMGYMLFSGHFAAAFLSLILTALAGSLAFRQHFYYFQMKQRRLGCTIKEWVTANLRGGK